MLKRLNAQHRASSYTVDHVVHPTVNPPNPECVMMVLWVKTGINSLIPTDLFWMNVPSGASLRALPDISRSPTSHT